MFFGFGHSGYHQPTYERCRHEWTNFHRACEPGNPNHNLEYLSHALEQDPKLTSYSTTYGDYPIYAAIYPRTASFDILKLLVDACPGAPFVEGSDGETAWERLRDRLNSDWNVYCLFLKAHDICDERAVSFRPVHAAASCKFRFGKTTGFLQICIEQDAENLRVQDEKGNFPLHIMLGAESKTLYYEPEYVRMILEAYPEAAATPNHNGKFPLHLALESGYCKCKWEQVIQPIMAAAPQAALVGSPLLLLVNQGREDTELDMLYSLLRVNPSQLNNGPTQPSTTTTQSLQGKKRARGSL
jgi:hypothetical protein